MTATMDDDLRARIAREAREWHTRLNSGAVDEAARRAFEGWLHADKANKRAYFELEQMWRDLDFAAVAAEVDVTAALRPPPAKGLGDRVARLFARPLFSPAYGMAALAAFGAIVAAALFLGLRLAPIDPAAVAVSEPDYATLVAEIREVRLEDGSVVTLGPKSELDTAFTADSRHVVLRTGEAFFEVAKDERRPFFVSVDDTLIRVVGTKFDVKRAIGDVHVSVLEGIVDVMKADDLAPAARGVAEPIITKRLTAGQKIVASAAAPEIREIVTTTPGAWRTGRLAYEDASLSEIIADVNRYSKRQIRLAAGAKGDIRLTTAFQSSEIDQWLRVIEETQGLAVEDRGEGEILLRPKG